MSDSKENTERLFYFFKTGYLMGKLLEEEPDEILNNHQLAFKYFIETLYKLEEDGKETNIH